MPRPSARVLPIAAREAAERFARTLGEAGRRAWLVGGTVRDLALGRVPGDLDFASAALPEEVEALFPRTVGVGRLFGTTIVVLGDVTIEHTTFRTEGGYSDGRRPDRLSFGTRLEEDAARRDFTVNALYLDPLDDTLLDPTGGLVHLGAGLLAAVGEARARFEEDALRLLRLARFAGGYGLQVERATLAGARAAAAGLARLSPERVLSEWRRMAEAPGTPRCLGVLGDLGLVEGALPGLSGRLDPAELESRVAVAAALRDAPGPARLLAALHDPGPPWDPAGRRAAREAFGALRPSRALAREVDDLWSGLAAAAPVPGEQGSAALLRRRKLLEREDADAVLALGRARASVRGRPEPAELDALADLAARLGPGQRRPEPLLVAADLVARGIAAGPRLGEWLTAAREAQLCGEVADRDAALRWLDERLGKR